MTLFSPSQKSSIPSSTFSDDKPFVPTPAFPLNSSTPSGTFWISLTATSAPSDMVAESDQQNHPPAPVLSGADRLRLRREAYLKARSGETTSSVELFEDLQPAPAPRVAHRAPQQQARNGSMAPKNLPGRNGSIRGHDSSGTTDRAGSVPAGSSTENGLRRVLMTSIEEPMQSVSVIIPLPVWNVVLTWLRCLMMRMTSR